MRLERFGVVLASSLALVACTRERAQPDGTPRVAPEKAPVLTPSVVQMPSASATSSKADLPVPAHSAASWPPPARSPKHGGKYWGVYLFVAPPSEAKGKAATQKLEQTKSLLDKRGLKFGLDFEEGSLNCDQGAPEALKAD